MIVSMKLADDGTIDALRTWVETRGGRTTVFAQDTPHVTIACTGMAPADANALAAMRGVTAVTPSSSWVLAARVLRPAGSVVCAGDGPGTWFGGSDLAVIAGPCAVEDRAMLHETAAAVRSAGAGLLRAGAWKPRTSPYTFQGLGEAALEWIAEVRCKTGMPVVTEVMDPRQIESAAACVDVLQIGARNMQNFALLAEIGRIQRPVLLKRGASATIEELLCAAEYILARGNHDIILCERGIRTFETATRNTLDTGAIAVLKRETHLPVIADPSHAAGRRDLVEPLALAAIAAGADGLIVEVHPHPESAQSDGTQSLTPDGFERLMRNARCVATAVGRHITQPVASPVEVAA